MSNVFLAWPDRDVKALWEGFGWKVAHTLDASVNLVQFTGGADINPALYGQHKHPTTHFNIKRDLHEYKVFRRARELGIPMAGICRGAQLLHAFCGGQLWQDIDNHGSCEHEIIDVESGEIFITNSVHHQCVLADSDAFANGFKVLAQAKNATMLERMSDTANQDYRITHLKSPQTWFEVEAFLYEEPRIFGFQGHPEYYCSNSMLPVNYLIWIEESILK